MEARSHFTRVKDTGGGSRTTPASSGINKVLLRMEAQNRALLTSANGKEPLKRKRQVMVTYNAAAAFKHRYIYLYSMFALADLPSPK